MRPDRAEIFRDKSRKWRYRVIAPNGRITYASEQGYRSKWYAKRKLAGFRPLEEFESVTVIKGN